MLKCMLKRKFLFASRLPIIAAIFLAAFAALTATAQTAAPQPTLKNVPAPWVGYLLIAVLLIMVLGVSLMPSKRSHQD